MKVLILGDGAALTTGFAQVIRHVAVGMVAKGWDVHQITSLDMPPLVRTEPYAALGITPWLPRTDVLGVGVLDEAMQQIKPDVIFLNCDPGSARQWFKYVVGYGGLKIPTVLYAPVEGAPICEDYALAFRMATRALTYTQWSTDRLHTEWNLDIPFIYHGVDTSVFHPLDEGEKRRVRAGMHWQGKYVVAYVARNNGRKGHDRLLRAVRLLLDGHQDGQVVVPPQRDILLYLHCQPVDVLGGWDLEQLIQVWGLEGHVQFALPQRTGAHGETQYSLAAKLASADLYIHPAQVEGFGLPILEAMASGLPIVVPKDEGNMEEVVGQTAFAKSPVHDWGTWFNGARLAVVHPNSLAWAVRHAREQKRLVQLAGERALARAQSFSWQAMTERLVNEVELAAAGETREPSLFGQIEPADEDLTSVLTFARTKA